MNRRRLFLLSITLIAAFAFLGEGVRAQSPRQSLAQLVKQLQSAPNDNALRAQIAHLVATMHPRPGIPEAARRYLIEGITIQKRAQSPADYALAIQDYQRALLIAPWSADAYYDMGIAFDLTKQFPAAIEALKLSVMVDPAGQGARAAQDKLYAVEGEQQQIDAANTAAAQAQSQQEAAAAQARAAQAARDEALIRSLDGSLFLSHDGDGVMERHDTEVHINNGFATEDLRVTWMSAGILQSGNGSPGDVHTNTAPIPHSGRTFTGSLLGPTNVPVVITVAPDGHTLTLDIDKRVETLYRQ